MADNSADELARGILRNIVPLDAGQAVAGPYQKAESIGLQLLRQLGLLPTPGYTPGLSEPLPIKDPKTGQMIYPEGYKGPR